MEKSVTWPPSHRATALQDLNDIDNPTDKNAQFGCAESCCRVAKSSQNIQRSLTCWIPRFLRSRLLCLPVPAPKVNQHGELLHDHALDIASSSGPQPATVFYLAYGSNLSAETFLGRRGIRPISQLNVVVPSLTLTFDLPGLPYVEPCFANSGLRRDSNGGDASMCARPATHPTSTEPSKLSDENTPLLGTLQLTTKGSPKYHKDRWHKGLVGVVYELTPADYAHVIATEGGGAAYHDIVVACHPLPPGTSVVPDFPSTPPLSAHTLFAPAIASPEPGKPPRKPNKHGRFERPDPSYAQPSARYLKLITDGADEHGLPAEYKDFLHGIRPYTLTTQQQRLGQFIFVSLWGPLLSFIFGLRTLFADENGRSPEWLIRFTGALFVATWASYDNFFFKTFGDGERTVGDDADEGVGCVRNSVRGVVDVEKAACCLV